MYSFSHRLAQLADEDVRKAVDSIWWVLCAWKRSPHAVRTCQFSKSLRCILLLKRETQYPTLRSKFGQTCPSGTREMNEARRNESRIHEIILLLWLSRIFKVYVLQWWHQELSLSGHCIRRYWWNLPVTYPLLSDMSTNMARLLLNHII